MFSGIVETTASIQSVVEGSQILTIGVARPTTFTDIHRGDSICANGVCLTVEDFDPSLIHFTLAKETLQVTGGVRSWQVGMSLNLERSLRLSDRIHGHLVTGHVDGRGQVVSRSEAGEAVIFRIEVPPELVRFVWQKGSVALNGVSLTVNCVEGRQIEVCLIPETLKRTNLNDLRPGTPLNIEGDYLAKALLRSIEISGVEAVKGASH